MDRFIYGWRENCRTVLGGPVLEQFAGGASGRKLARDGLARGHCASAGESCRSFLSVGEPVEALVLVSSCGRVGARRGDVPALFYIFHRNRRRHGVSRDLHRVNCLRRFFLLDSRVVGRFCLFICAPGTFVCFRDWISLSKTNGRHSEKQAPFNSSLRVRRAISGVSATCVWLDKRAGWQFI